MALLDRPADERVIGAQVEDVVLVDPGRHDQQRALEHRLRRRGVLDELDEVVLEHDLARRDADVLTELERLHVGHLDVEAPLAVLEVGQEVLQPVEQVLAVRFDRGAQHLGVGHDEVCGREGVGELARIEVHLARGRLVEPVGFAHHVGEPAGRQQVGLLDVIEDRVFLPGGIAEAPVARFGHGKGRSFLAKHLSRRGLPQVQVALPQFHLRMGEAHRIRHHARGQREESATEIERIGIMADAVRCLALEKIAHNSTAALGDIGERSPDFWHSVRSALRRRLIGHGDFLMIP